MLRHKRGGWYSPYGNVGYAFTYKNFEMNWELCVGVVTREKNGQVFAQFIEPSDEFGSRSYSTQLFPKYPGVEFSINDPYSLNFTEQKMKFMLSGTELKTLTPEQAGQPLVFADSNDLVFTELLKLRKSPKSVDKCHLGEADPANVYNAKTAKQVKELKTSVSEQKAFALDTGFGKTCDMLLRCGLDRRNIFTPQHSVPEFFKMKEAGLSVTSCEDMRVAFNRYVTKKFRFNVFVLDYNGAVVDFSVNGSCELYNGTNDKMPPQDQMVRFAFKNLLADECVFALVTEKYRGGQGERKCVKGTVEQNGLDVQKFVVGVAQSHGYKLCGDVDTMRTTQRCHYQCYRFVR